MGSIIQTEDINSVNSLISSEIGRRARWDAEDVPLFSNFQISISSRGAIRSWEWLHQTTLSQNVNLLDVSINVRVHHFLSVPSIIYSLAGTLHVHWNPFPKHAKICERRSVSSGARMIEWIPELNTHLSKSAEEYFFRFLIIKIWSHEGAWK
jgi:hypothetical protein